MFKIRFIQTPKFEKQIKKIASEKELKQFKDYLLEYPERGDLIQGGGGVRKIRIKLDNRGKSGGARVLYYYIQYQFIFLIRAYSKNEVESVSKAEIAELKEIVKLIKKEVKNGKI